MSQEESQSFAAQRAQLLALLADPKFFADMTDEEKTLTRRSLREAARAMEIGASLAERPHPFDPSLPPDALDRTKEIVFPGRHAPHRPDGTLLNLFRLSHLVDWEGKRRAMYTLVCVFLPASDVWHTHPKIEIYPAFGWTADEAQRFETWKKAHPIWLNPPEAEELECARQATKTMLANVPKPDPKLSNQENSNAFRDAMVLAQKRFTEARQAYRQAFAARHKAAHREPGIIRNINDQFLVGK